LIKKQSQIMRPNEENSFQDKVGKLWSHIRTESLLALLWNPIHMLLKIVYVLDIILFEDGPVIQFYIAVAS